MDAAPELVIEADVAPGSPLEAMRSFFDRGMLRGDLESIRPLLHPDVIGIGTGKHEWNLGAAGAMAAFERDAAQMPAVVDVRCSDVEVREHGDSAVVQCRFILRVRADEGIVALDPLRWSAALIRHDGAWRFVHFHVSSPMRQQSEGRSFPELDELLEEKRTLERLVAERTRELAEERARVEELLQRELAHQVAERSRELGAALVRSGAAQRSAPPPSARFGARYRIVRPLGEGGMGAVFEVERQTDGQRLALKVMTGDASVREAARFAREAEIGARLRHAHLVSIVDIGITDGGAPFLAMELVTGGSLEAHRARFGESAWALPILRHAASGLVALHEAGVVHRDLKPANVLLDETGVAKLGDFGIARFGSRIGALDPDAPTMSGYASPLTGTGAWIGTPAYMAPETARSPRDVGPAADVFSFGVLAYELLTREAPFTVPPILLALIGVPIPTPARASIDVASSLLDALEACLADDPAQRPTAAALLDALG